MRSGVLSRMAPVVGLGVLSAALACAGANQQWVTLPESADFQTRSLDLGVPLAGALSFVALACWGVVLVTRSWLRRVISGVGAASAIGVLVTAVSEAPALPGRANDSAADFSDLPLDAHLNVWFWVSLVCAVVSAGAFVTAVIAARSWPEMGQRYDAPSSAATAPQAKAVVAPDADSFDVWKSIDQGHDPTDQEPGHGTH